MSKKTFNVVVRALRDVSFIRLSEWCPVKGSKKCFYYIEYGKIPRGKLVVIENIDTDDISYKDFGYVAILGTKDSPRGFIKNPNESPIGEEIKMVEVYVDKDSGRHFVSKKELLSKKTRPILSGRLLLNIP
ncbi:MAG TPA: hypothetical protein VJ900_01710 [Patescibacteria group bacterium]|nr:hypothetical protein [Patescibacteria group bacterium]